MTHKNLLSRENSLTDAFDFLDKDKTGFIEKSELIQLLEGSQAEEIKILMENMDENHDDKISRQ